MSSIFLINQLKEIETISDQQWLNSLGKRKKKELEFLDKDREPSRIESMDKDTYEKFYGNIKYYKATSLSKVYVDNWVKEECKNRVFLDYACGNGGNAIKAAKYGSELSIGLDISRISIENAKREAKKAGVNKNIYFIQADAENTMLPDNSIDVVICSGM